MKLLHSKIYPSDKSRPPSSSSGTGIVDLIVEDVEQDIFDIQRSHDKEFGANLMNVKNDVGRDVNRSKSIKMSTSENYESKSNDESDFKFSHEMLENESKITNELNEQFLSVVNQLNEYKARYLEANNKIKELDSKLNQSETKLEETEEEVVKLQEELRSSQTGSVGLPVAAKTGRATGSGNGAHTQQEIEMNKRAEQIRKALLSDEDGEEVAGAMDELLQSRDLWAILRGYMRLYAPFKSDIRQMQAKFGSSVASYFVFSRFV